MDQGRDTGELKLFSVAGVPVLIAPSSLIFAAVLTVIYAPTVQDDLPSLSTAGTFAVAAVFAVLLYGSVLLHEIAHALMALRLGLTVHRMRLELLGGSTETQPAPTPGREALVAVVGPLVNLALFAIGLALRRALPDDTVGHTLAGMLTNANVVVGLFNLLPGLPLDGGRVLAAGVWRATSRRTTGVVAAAYAGRFLAAALFVLLVIGPVLRGRTPSYIGAVVGALVAWFLWSGASQALSWARMHARLPRVVAGTLARRALPVAADVPLAEALRRLDLAGGQALVVVDGNASPIGIVDDAAVAAVPVDRRPWLDVSALSRRLLPSQILGAELAGEALVTAMSVDPAAAYLVIGADDRPVGVLITADVERALAAA